MLLDEVSPCLLDSPTLARVERARVRHEGGQTILARAPFWTPLNESIADSQETSETIKRGLLWQQRDKIFARWKERYFILTRDYLHCFRRASGAGANKISQMGPFLFKVRLVSVEKVEWVNRRNYSTVVIHLVREGRVLLRAITGLEDWFEVIEECVLSSKERRSALRLSRDASFRLDDRANSISSVNSSLEEWLGMARRKIAGLQQNIHTGITSDSQASRNSRPLSIAPDLEHLRNSRPLSLASSLQPLSPVTKTSDLQPSRSSFSQTRAPILEPLRNNRSTLDVQPPRSSHPQSFAPNLQPSRSGFPQALTSDIQPPISGCSQTGALNLQASKSGRAQLLYPDLQLPRKGCPQSLSPNIQPSRSCRPLAVAPDVQLRRNGCPQTTALSVEVDYQNCQSMDPDDWKRRWTPDHKQQVSSTDL